MIAHSADPKRPADSKSGLCAAARFFERIAAAWAWGSISLVLAVTAFLFIFVFVQGWSVLSWEFLTQPPRGAVLGEEGGIFPAIVGSLCFTGLAVIMAVVPAAAAAMYVVFYSGGRVSSAVIRLAVQCMSGIPSIVLGLFSYSFMVRELGLGRCILSASTALAVMILPFIEVRAEKAFRDLPSWMTEASRALGCSRGYTMVRIVLPACRGELISAMILGGCYAMGATAPLMFTGGVAYASLPDGLLSPAMALPLHLYLLLAQGATSMSAAYGTAFVMMALILVSNLLASLYQLRKKRWKIYR